MQPERKANLWNRLVKLDQSKKTTSTCAILTATSDARKKKRSLLNQSQLDMELLALYSCLMMSQLHQ